ncbi:hypothetical protein OAZ21_03325 [Bacteroidota bacterium]|nr:hypothetical protein [Bacteroidota bacterium]
MSYIFANHSNFSNPDFIIYSVGIFFNDSPSVWSSWSDTPPFLV